MAKNKWDSDKQSVKPVFSLIVTFYLTKTENRTKKYLNSSHTIALDTGTILAKKQ